jgi:hypothetical protein
LNIDDVSGKKIWKYQNFRLIEEIEVTNSAYPVNPKAALINLSGTIFLMKVFVVHYRIIGNFRTEKS